MSQMPLDEETLKFMSTKPLSVQLAFFNALTEEGTTAATAPAPPSTAPPLTGNHECVPKQKYIVTLILHFQTHFAVRTRTTMCNGLNMANTRKSWLRAPTSEARFVISVKICM